MIGLNSFSPYQYYERSKIIFKIRGSTKMLLYWFCHFFLEVQLMTSAPDDNYLLSDQDTN